MTRLGDGRTQAACDYFKKAYGKSLTEIAKQHERYPIQARKHKK